ncbi:MAG: chlorite dismutase [Dehalococcoidia bacterium]|nr:chlorite dismutase [Dehalococcoidia bacterium]
MSEEGQRQYVKFTFYKVDSPWLLLPKEQKERDKEEFQAAVAEFANDMMVRTYNLQGMRGDTDFLIWTAGFKLEAVQEMASRLRSTGLGRYLSSPYSYLAMTRRSMYLGSHRHEGQEGARNRIVALGAKYLFVYPFVKTRAWYLLSKEERQRIMNVHFQVGHKYPSVKINTTYSYGLDDQEFVLAFETDSPSDFLDLVMELRDTESSSYTLRDTPIFTCINSDLKDIVDSLAY